MIYAIRSYSIYPERDEPVWLCWQPSEFEEESYIWVEWEEFSHRFDLYLDDIDKFVFNSEEEARQLAEEIGIVDDFEVVAIK